MTQARNYPKTTTTLSDDNFISDDGTTTFTNKVDVIKNAYNFLIGSCVFLNETDPIIYDENEFRKITYLRYKGTAEIKELISITQTKNSSYPSRLGINVVNYSTGSAFPSYGEFWKDFRINKSHGTILCNVIDIDKDNKNFTFNLDVPNFFKQLPPYTQDSVKNPIAGRPVSLAVDNGTLKITGMLSLQPEATGLISNIKVNSFNQLTFADVKIEQDPTLEEITFGTKNYKITPGEGLSMEILEKYPLLKIAFQQHNINQLSEVVDEDLMLGYTDSFKIINFQEEEHSHKFQVNATSDAIQSRVIPVLDGGNIKTRETTNRPVRNYFKDIIGNYRSSNIDTSTSTSTVPAGDKTRVNSYSSTPYVIAQIDWK